MLLLLRKIMKFLTRTNCGFNQPSRMVLEVKADYLVALVAEVVYLTCSADEEDKAVTM